jgi:predicted nucleotidyltransferase
VSPESAKDRDPPALAESAERYRLGDLEISTIGLEDLIRIKQHIRRDKDLESLRQLLAIRLVRNEARPPDVTRDNT